MLHYTKIFSCPAKEWLILLHGLGGKSTLFYKQADYLSKHYNLVFIDLPGHGDSEGLNEKFYEAKHVAPKIIEVLDALHINQAHFVTFSVGTIVGNELLHTSPSYIRTMTLAGPVLKFNLWSKTLIESAWHLRPFASYMLFYKIFARLIMPKKTHAKSRYYFVREAAHLGRKEFIKWTNLLKNAYKPYEQLKAKPVEIPLLYLIGNEDHLFLKEAKLAATENPYATLHIIDHCGHVCVIEKSEICNEAIHTFIQTNNSYKKASTF